IKSTRSGCLALLLVLMCVLGSEVTADVEGSSDGLSTTREPTWLTDVPSAVELIAAAEVAVVGFFQDLEIPLVSTFRSMAQQFQDISFGISNSSEVLNHYNVTSNTICLFRLVDNEQLRLDGTDIENTDATKLSRFIHINNLRWVTEYSPLTASGLFNTMIQTHLLLMVNKASPKYEESMRRYQEAAKLFQGQILFVLVDSNRKENKKVIAYFKLKESELPALAIYEMMNDTWDTLSISEVTVEHVQGFCEGFLRRQLMRDEKLEESTPKEEL
uniref:Endoplasmic reticulum resident protein 27 n=2 Tax=Nannospalax galili TaxID=1026970 RepID=A0A8C6WAZ6_NANGA